MSNRSKRHQPYDLNNPLNWTVGKLKNEIAKKGMNITSTISKAALLQIYNQLSGINQEPRPNTVEDDVMTPSAVHNVVQVQQQVPVADSASNSYHGGKESSDSSALGVLASTVLSLQETVNKLIQDKQSNVSTSTNMLTKIYQGHSDGTSSSSVVNVTHNQHDGVGADDLPHIDVVSESLRKQIREGKYVNLASLLIPDFDTLNFTTNELSGLELLRQSCRDHRLDKALTITQFLYGIYKRIMCEVFLKDGQSLIFMRPT